MDSMEEIYMKHGKMIYGFLLTRTPAWQRN